MLKVFVASADIAELENKIQLSEYRKSKIDRIRVEHSKRERKAIGVLLAYALKKEFGLSEAEMSYAEEDNGKPYFPFRKDIHFNISHSNNFCAVAISDEADVGIDIEDNIYNARRINTVLDSRFLSAREISAFKLENKDRLCNNFPLFYRLWTAKESIVKCTGDGIANGFKKLEIPFFEKSCRIDDLFLYCFEDSKFILNVASYSHTEPSFKFAETTEISEILLNTALKA